MSLTPAAPGSGSVVKIKRATQAKWQLKGQPGVSVTPVAPKSQNGQEGESSSMHNSTIHQEHSSKNHPSIAITNIRPSKHGNFNGEEQTSNIHMSTSMQNMFNQDDSEREHETTDDEDMVHRMLLEPQVILDTSTTDQVIYSVRAIENIYLPFLAL